MAPSISIGKTTLTYPLFAVDFDPENDGRLIVGGGGGEGRSGVGNKITVLDVSKPDISTITELELSRDEDSVTSLAVPWSRPDGTVITVFAGVNSSQKAEKNEHFRRFIVKPGEKSDDEGGWTREPLLSLFSDSVGPNRETYQRVTRLSPVREGPPNEDGGYSVNPRMCAIASGFGTEGEIVFSQTLQPEAVLGRINLGKGVEAADIDLIETAPQKYLAAYCTDYDVCIYEPFLNRKKKGKSVPKLLYTQVPRPGGKGRPTFRALRFLTPSLILLLSNLPGRSGAELLVFKIGGTTGAIVMQKRLHTGIRAGMGLDVAILSDRYDDLEGGDKQFLIAVAGQDISIELLTLEYSESHDGLTTFRPYTIFKDVHPVQMTKLAFSRFIPRSSSVPVSPQPIPPRLRLASISMGNTVAIHTLPLFPVPASPKSKSAATTAEKPYQRYILTAPSRASQEAKQALSILFSLIVVSIAAIAIQTLLELRGGSPPVLHIADRIPVGLRNYLEKPAQQWLWEGLASNVKAEGEVIKDRLQDLLIQHRTLHEPKVIIMRDTETEVTAHVIPEGYQVPQAENVRNWEELPEEERAVWKKKLVDAGKWAYEEGEGVLRSVLWSQLGGIVEGVINGG